MQCRLSFAVEVTTTSGNWKHPLPLKFIFNARFRWLLCFRNGWHSTPPTLCHPRTGPQQCVSRTYIYIYIYMYIRIAFSIELRLRVSCSLRSLANYIARSLRSGEQGSSCYGVLVLRLTACYGVKESSRRKGGNYTPMKRLRSDRFSFKSFEEIKSMFISTQPKTTVYSTNWALKNFEDWKKNRNLCHPDDQVPKDLMENGNEVEICKWLSLYIIETRSCKGEPYPIPISIWSASPFQVLKSYFSQLSRQK